MLNGFFSLFLALQSSSARATDLLVFSQYINLFMFMSITVIDDHRIFH